MASTTTPKPNTTKPCQSNYSSNHRNSESLPTERQHSSTALSDSTSDKHRKQSLGGSHDHPKPFNTFRVISWNVNTLSTQQDYLQWRAASQAISNSEADAIAFQETNLSWNKIHRRRIQQILQQPTGNATLATTNSTEISSDTYQRGGTLLAIVGSWTSRTISSGHDTKGLGRWSFIELQGKDDQHYIVLLGYRVGDNQTVDLGSNNTYNQQFRILHQQGEPSPDPRTQFLDDLIHQIQVWQEQHKAVLICIDANDNPQQESTNGDTRIFQETDLCDLHSVKHPHQHRPQHTTKVLNRSTSAQVAPNLLMP